MQKRDIASDHRHHARADWLVGSLLRAYPPSAPFGQLQPVDTFTVYSSMKARVMWQMPLQRSVPRIALLTHLEQLKAK